MKKFMEKASILSLSLVLTTAFSISSALPAMLDFYKAYPPSQVELLVSLPSFGIMAMLILNGFLERFLTEKQLIVTGLLVLSLCSFAPLISQAYGFIFVSRLVFGLGVGMINAKAISIISERYQGKERTQMLGYRGSAEVVGTALLTLLVGQLLVLGWTWTFLVYSLGFVVLFLYLFFVPYEKVRVTEAEQSQEAEKMPAGQLRLSFLLALVAAVIVCTNIVINLRLPGLVLDNQLGTAQTASLVLSAMQLVGILAGLSFANLESIFQTKLLAVSGLVFGIGQILIGLSGSIYLLAFSALLSGFAYSISLTAIFHILADRIPARFLNRATSVVVLGCSCGASATTFILSLLGTISSQPVFIFGVSGTCMILVAGWAYRIIQAN